MNICIVSNYTKTYLYDKIAEQLAKDGIQAYWIVVNQNLYQFLIDIYGQDRVLLINKKNIKQTQEPIGSLKINELIYGDRVLRNFPKEGSQFLQNIQSPIHQFLKEHNIRYTFGETTWAHEILIHRICKFFTELKCQYLDLHSVRIPYNRFAFFPEEGQGKVLKINKSIKEEPNIISPKKPDYVKIFDQQIAKSSSFSGRLDRIKRLISNENMDKEDPTLLSNFRKRIIACSQEEWRKETYKKLKTTNFESVQKKSYVFVGLHVQPEASVDVFGRYYEDQLQNIRNLWRALPEGWNLLVKEHSNAIGNRSSKFYESVQQLPNTYLISEKTNSYEVVKKAKLVATITGTLSYEAALMGVPSITFVPMFFNYLNYCQRITLEDLQRYDLREIADSIIAKENNIAEFSAFLYSNTFEGNVIDPISDKRVLDSANISAICQAMRSVFKDKKCSVKS